LASNAIQLTSPTVDLVITAVIAWIALQFCARDWPQLRPLLTTYTLDQRSWWVPVVMLGLIPVFMESYCWTLDWLGVATVSELEPFFDHDWPIWIAFVLSSAAPGIFEELAFRGFILGRLLQVMRSRDALLAQAAMFSLLHLNPLVFVSHFVVGLLLGITRLRTGSLWPCIGLHMLWNGWVLFDELVTVW